MKDWMVNLYHRLPGPAPSVAASLRGFYLRSWRYGSETEGLIQQALDREQWTAKQWQVWQEERLAYILQRAATTVPYYRDYWNKRRTDGDQRSWELLENWPVLKKQAVRAHPESFVADDCNLKRMYRERTSGTTGTPLTIWMSKATLRAWYALFEARTRRWLGVSQREPWGILGGQLIVDAKTQLPPFWVWNAGMNQLYMSVFHLNPANCNYYLEALKKYGVTHLLGYSSSLYVLAKAAEEQGLKAPQLRGVITNAEALWPRWRETISKVFECPVQSTYGMAELALAGSDCAFGNLHLWPETGLLELLEPAEDRGAAVGEEGRLILTGLLNADMPLIRYEVGDWGRAVESDGLCGCRRSLPILPTVEGRTGDMITTTDGRQIFWANNIFAELKIHELQVIQEKLDRLRLFVVPGSDFSARDHDQIVKKLRQRVGPMQIDIELVKSIPRASTGKFQTVVNKVPYSIAS
jgi:phenylacetate-CoA ligase